MLRFHLPPNLAAAAARNAIPIRVEMNLAAAPPPELVPVLALLQRWCGPKPPAFVQLTRAQVRDLVDAAGDQPLFVENGQPTVWDHDDLVREAATPASTIAAAQNPKLMPQGPA